jgi:hypothetical protein
MADQPDKPADAIPRVTEQQRREELAHAERKKHIAKTPEILEAFANGWDRLNPAPDRK